MTELLDTVPMPPKKSTLGGYNYKPEEAKRLDRLRHEVVLENKRVEALRAEVEAARAVLRPAPEPEPFVRSGIAEERTARMNAYRAARNGRRGRAAARTTATVAMSAPSDTAAASTD